MSRVGRNPIPIPSGAKVKLDGQHLVVEGPKGTLSLTLHAAISLTVGEKEIRVARASDVPSHRALHGLHRALIANMVQGVVSGFTKELEITGVGYRAAMQGSTLTLTVGYSHPVIIQVPDGITVTLPKPTMVVVEGFDKHAVGQFAADVRQAAPPEPYKGKGIKYVGEVIRRKAGKAATGAGAKG